VVVEREEEEHLVELPRIACHSLSLTHSLEFNDDHQRDTPLQIAMLQNADSNFINGASMNECFRAMPLFPRT
jgi:hypothetical protein